MTYANKYNLGQKQNETVTNAEKIRPHKQTSPISSKNFLDSVRYRAQNLGRLSGVDAAEGFTVERVPVIQSFSNLF